VKPVGQVLVLERLNSVMGALFQLLIRSPNSFVAGVLVLSFEKEKKQ